MGPGIAVGMAQAGHTVALYGRSAASLERGFATMNDILGLLTEGDVISPREAEQVRSRIRGTTDLHDAVALAAVVCESIVEDLEIKRRIFEELEQQVGEDTVLATNTSSLPITRIAANLRRPSAR